MKILALISIDVANKNVENVDDFYLVLFSCCVWTQQNSDYVSKIPSFVLHWQINIQFYLNKFNKSNRKRKQVVKVSRRQR